jgi:hypothetical protein
MIQTVLYSDLSDQDYITWLYLYVYTRIDETGVESYAGHTRFYSTPPRDLRTPPRGWRIGRMQPAR